MSTSQQHCLCNRLCGWRLGVGCGGCLSCCVQPCSTCSGWTSSEVPCCGPPFHYDSHYKSKLSTAPLAGENSIWQFHILHLIGQPISLTPHGKSLRPLGFWGDLCTPLWDLALCSQDGVGDLAVVWNLLVIGGSLVTRGGVKYGIPIYPSYQYLVTISYHISHILL